MIKCAVLNVCCYVPEPTGVPLRNLHASRVCPCLLGTLVDEVGFVLGVDDLLAAVKAVVTGYGITKADGKQEERCPFKSKQLKAYEQGCDRTVGHTAEECAHTDSRTQRWRKADQVAKHRSKGSSDEKGRYDLAALVTASKGQCCKEDL